MLASKVESKEESNKLGFASGFVSSVEFVNVGGSLDVHVENSKLKRKTNSVCFEKAIGKKLIVKKRS